MLDLVKNPYTKGQFEYMSRRKRQQLTIALVCFFIGAAFMVTGYLIYHTRKNLLMWPGLMMVIPFANAFVSWLALGQHKDLDAEKRAFLAPYEEAGMVLYHMMYVEEKGRRQYLDATVIYVGGIVSFTGAPNRTRKADFETDCIVRLKKTAAPLRMKIYTDWNEFTERLRNVAPEVAEEDSRKLARAQELFSGMCL